MTEFGSLKSAFEFKACTGYTLATTFINKISGITMGSHKISLIGSNIQRIRSRKVAPLIFYKIKK